MYMAGIFNLVANLNSFHPAVGERIFDGHTMGGIRFQHLPDQTPASAGGEVVDRWRTGGNGRRGVSTGSSICSIEGISLRLCGSPRQFLEVEAVVNDPACPNIDEPSVIGCSQCER